MNFQNDNIVIKMSNYYQNKHEERLLILIDEKKIE